MEEAINTECLRSLAPNWSLAGDKKLLCLLQDIHQKIMNRCQETSTKLEEMTIALDGANIDLQNVNNKFMALSNSQFIESRVYDDDLEVTTENKVTKAESAVTTNQDMTELAKLKQSLKVLESMHESIRIIDSDSDSDLDEVDGRMVFRPKDLYAGRPLPYIIGSQAWKNKWHAGILAEDSDSDDTTSKQDDEVPEQYSESESDMTDTRTDRLVQQQRTVSSNSSMADSEPSAPAAPVTQANIAAEVARKLGGNLPEIPVRTPELEPELTKPRTGPSQIYKPQNPPTSTIFFDEPPPIDQSYQSDRDDYNDEEDDDIFAELHKTKPSSTTNKDQSQLNEALFGDFNNSPDIASNLFGTEKRDSTTAQINNVEPAKESDKKPIGGISLFGSSKGTESIGAAILKRNQRKTYSSDEESEKGMIVNKQKPTKNIQPEKVNANVNTSTSISKVDLYSVDGTITNEVQSVSETKTVRKQEKDILQDILDKNKPTKINKEKQEPNLKENTELFSDNIFDDIDDIFTDTIVRAPIKEPNKNVKSIFDVDDDDLFADIAVTSRKETSYKGKDNNTGGLFDSDNDDHLFSDTTKESSKDIKKAVDVVGKAENNSPLKIKEPKSIFDDDSDEDIFSNINVKTRSNEDIKKHTLFERKESGEKYSIEPSEETEDGEDGDSNYLFSDGNLIISNSHSKSRTNMEENNAIESKATEQVNKIVNNEELYNSSHNSQNVTLVSHAETSKDLNNLSSNGNDYETVVNSVNRNEIMIEDDWDDSNFTESQLENIIESSEVVKADDSSSNVTKNTVVEKQHQNSKLIEQNSDLFVSASLEIPTENRVERHSDFNKIDFNSENLRDLPTGPSDEIAQNPNTFSDIFNDVPPAFEKPTEPKKSKNVNALFDDDSDDEALFFKKNDIISDEKPDLNSIAKDDTLFRIFSDEPPSMDVDFTQRITDSQRSETEDGEPIDFIESNVHDKESTMNKVIGDNNGEVFLPQADAKNKEDQTGIVGDAETKKSIGKLKSMIINIDVNSLLPGASPKKVKVLEQVDGQVVSSSNVNTSIEIGDAEPKLVKSVSFEGEADSELLDNKLSKERAKIQVKRRPSTRRARREAVKRSGIDFVSDDVTDNTHNINNPQVATVTFATENTGKETVQDVVKASNEQNIKSKVVYILNDEDIFSNVNTNYTVGHSGGAVVSNIKENFQKLKTDVVTSDDDDIFKKIKVAKLGSSTALNLTGKNEHQTSDSFGKTDVVFQRKTDRENQNVTIKAVNNLEKSVKNTASIFDNLSDDETELFQGKKQLAQKTKNIFGSDSDEELFGISAKKPVEHKEDIQKSTSIKVEVKKSLFDDDSDDDLFGRKSSSSGKKPLYSKADEVKPTHTQSVDEDPLSLLTNDVTDDI